MRKNRDRWKIWIDTGGTFTDCLAVDPGGMRHRAKVLSSSALRGQICERVSPRTYCIEQAWEAPDGFITDFQFRLLNNTEARYEVIDFDAGASVVVLDRPLPEDAALRAPFEVLTDEEAPLLAARLVTGTPAGGALPPLDLRLATTKGTNALLERTGAPTVLFVTEGYHDLLDIGTQQRPELFALQVKKPKPLYTRVVEVPERMDAQGTAIRPIDLSALADQVEAARAAGIESAAVALMNSYRNPAHEEQLAAMLREHGFKHVSVSSDLVRFIKLLPRLETALVNSYLQPIIEAYLDAVGRRLPQGSLSIMTSAGGLVQRPQFRPKDSLLSGPAGGVVGAATASRKAGIDKVISFDMGGTSTDVARYDGDYEYVFEHEVGDAHLVAPALAIETVASGGGSVCSYDGHTLRVGPESGGAHPGPACYGAGGPLTITDVNLLLGRLDPLNFTIPVAPKAARERLDEIVEAVNQEADAPVAPEVVLEGFLDIANERMADVIRKISLRRGYDPSDYALVSYGGAGGQHASAVARRLGIRRVLVPADAGLLSAYGLGHAVLEQFAERQLLKPLDDVEANLSEQLDALADEARRKLIDEGADAADVEVRRRLVFLRLQGQEAAMEVPYFSGGDEHVSMHEAFRRVYEQRYGHWLEGRTVEVESVRVVASTSVNVEPATISSDVTASPEPVNHKPIRFGGEMIETPVYHRRDLPPGASVSGPALILDPYSTVVLEPDWEVAVDGDGTLHLRADADVAVTAADARPEAVRLELFTNRFRSIADEMGEMLQRTALSVNVKERLDFSCGLLDPRGELVVNAPHIPVHLGALGLCVRSLMTTIEMEPGDVIITNHPAFGGAHLPDVTLVTPVHTDNGALIGFVASRTHHAEIGGLRPGSMPPTATRLVEEGVVIPPMHLIRKGEVRWEQIREHMLKARYPTRSIEENMTDFQAALAANHRGAAALRGLVAAHGLDEVHHYMDALKRHAASKMRETIRTLPNGTFVSVEHLDDGAVLSASIEVSDEHIRIDFSGTSGVHPGNLNSTPAIVNSVVMYVLRLLIDEPLPLNEGLLEPVELYLPESMLNPAFDEDPAMCPAVVGGNVETSQRLVDTLLKPFERIACSQGTMNNVLFGNDHFGYYETVCGGTGAGPGFDGADAVHHHMTNTRATDPEILEHRYPVRLERYEIRRGSGGRGRFNGGSGVERELVFLEPVSLSVLTQHRAERPYGLQGGGPGQAGEQWVIYADGRREQLLSVDGRELKPGDRFLLRTPGGGGFGPSEGS